jgi:threonine dehydratase
VSTPDLPVTAADVAAAGIRVAEVAIRTPLVPSVALSRRCGVEVTLKLESVQPTGSFKIRGAASKIGSLDAEVAARGVVTASTGNHGRAVAHVAARLDVPATICLSDNVPAGKVRALEALGCEVVIGGQSQAAALVTAADLVAQRDATLVHPFDDVEVIAGQGTIASEMLEDAPDVTTVLIPLSGGGLAAGIAVATKTADPGIRLVGISMERAAVMAASLDAGHPVDLPEEPTLADSLQGGIGLDNATSFPILAALLDEVVLIDEQAIWDGMRFAFDEHRLVLEGGGAVGIAALLHGAVDVSEDGHVVIVASGANAEPAHIAALAEGRPTPPTA